MPLLDIGILGGTLLASALQALFSIGATAAANKYNSPVSQLRRLRKAGLPMAFMYQGKVNQQSDVPKLSIDPHLGTLAKLQGEESKERAQLIDTQQEDLADDIQVKSQMSGVIQPDGIELNNRATTYKAEQQRKIAEAFTSQYASEIKKIELAVENEAFAEGISINKRREELIKIKQQVTNLLAQAGLMEQLKKIRGFEEMLNQALTEDIKSMPDWVEGFLKILMLATRRK